MRIAALAVPSALALSLAAPAGAFELTVLHINDLHSRILPINKYDSTCSAEDDAAGECFGGVARIKTLLDQRRAALAAEGANVLTLDAGDQFQGSLFYITYKGRAAVEFMNAIGFDAMAVGNHEFDDGPGKLASSSTPPNSPSSPAISTSRRSPRWPARSRPMSCWRSAASASAWSRRWRPTRTRPPRPAPMSSSRTPSRI
jgi:2',3'-cyclic-nucleotide 2'-phosphodiesterase (5'-nucleotidase family)